MNIFVFVFVFVFVAGICQHQMSFLWSLVYINVIPYPCPNIDVSLATRCWYKDDALQRDNDQHVLFVCVGLDTALVLWDSVLQSMPDPLMVELSNSHIKKNVKSFYRASGVNSWENGLKYM